LLHEGRPPTATPTPNTSPKGSEFKRGLENSLRDFNMLFGISQRAFGRRLHIGSTLYARR
jgi:hypothetical protein